MEELSNEVNLFYICPVCFQVCESETECHAHKMIACDPGPEGDERRKPVENQFGELASRAPRWFIEAAGWFVRR
jgi:hypothetical protein